MKDGKNAVKVAEKAGEKKDQVANCASELGDIRLHDNVISNLVRRAVLKVEGVSRLAGSSLVDNIAGIVGSRKIQDRAISIVKDQDDTSKIVVDIRVHVLYGFKVHEVAEAVQRAVIELVESTANVAVTAVNVSIQELDEEAAAEEEEGAAGGDAIDTFGN